MVLFLFFLWKFLILFFFFVIIIISWYITISYTEEYLLTLLYITTFFYYIKWRLFERNKAQIMKTFIYRDTFIECRIQRDVIKFIKKINMYGIMFFLFRSPCTHYPHKNIKKKEEMNEFIILKCITNSIQSFLFWN